MAKRRRQRRRQGGRRKKQPTAREQGPVWTNHLLESIRRTGGASYDFAPGTGTPPPFVTRQPQGVAHIMQQQSAPKVGAAVEEGAGVIDDLMAAARKIIAAGGSLAGFRPGRGGPDMGDYMGFHDVKKIGLEKWEELAILVDRVLVDMTGSGKIDDQDIESLVDIIGKEISAKGQTRQVIKDMNLKATGREQAEYLQELIQNTSDKRLKKWMELANTTNRAEMVATLGGAVNAPAMVNRAREAAVVDELITGQAVPEGGGKKKKKGKKGKKSKPATFNWKKATPEERVRAMLLGGPTGGSVRERFKRMTIPEGVPAQASAAMGPTLTKGVAAGLGGKLRDVTGLGDKDLRRVINELNKLDVAPTEEILQTLGRQERSPWLLRKLTGVGEVSKGPLEMVAPTGRKAMAAEKVGKLVAKSRPFGTKVRNFAGRAALPALLLEVLFRGGDVLKKVDRKLGLDPQHLLQQKDWARRQARSVDDVIADIEQDQLLYQAQSRFARRDPIAYELMQRDLMGKGGPSLTRNELAVVPQMMSAGERQGADEQIRQLLMGM